VVKDGVKLLNLIHLQERKARPLPSELISIKESFINIMVKDGVQLLDLIYL
jgi:hypothetical protein